MVDHGRSNYYLLTNKSGGTVTKGQTVVIDTSNNISFTTTTTAGDFRAFGIVADASILNNAIGQIQIMGSIVPVLATSAAVTRGHYIKQGTVAGKVITTGTACAAAVAPPTGSIGVALTGVGAAGNIVAYLFNTSPGTVAGATSFIGLSDVPADFTGDSLKAVRVNAGETALEFYTPSVASSLFSPDTPPGSPNAMDDEFNDASGMSGPVNGIDSQWTWRNQGGAAVTFPRSNLLKFDFPASTNNWRFLEQAITGDFSFAAKMTLEGTNADFAQACLAVIDRTNGDFYAMSVVASNPATVATLGVTVAAWTNVTTFSANHATPAYGKNTVYFRIDRVSSTLNFYYSSDGIGWIRAVSLTDTLNITGIAIGGNEGSNTGLTNVYCEWFRRLS